MGMSKKLKMMLMATETTQNDVAACFGVSKSNISKRFAKDNWREDDMYKMAELCGCKIVQKIILPDGTEI